jgi:hypothetical protein
MSHLRLTRSVREGLLMATILADSWREADGDEALTDREVADLEAANAYVRAGGLRRPTDKPRKGEDDDLPRRRMIP